MNFSRAFFYFYVSNHLQRIYSPLSYFFNVFQDILRLDRIVSSLLNSSFVFLCSTLVREASAFPLPAYKNSRVRGPKKARVSPEIGCTASVDHCACLAKDAGCQQPALFPTPAFALRWGTWGNGLTAFAGQARG